MVKKDDLKVDTNLKLIIKSSTFLFIFLVISKVFTYLYRILIARTFGPEIYGVFSLAVMILGWFVLFSSFGLHEGLIRYIPLYRGKKQSQKIKTIYTKTVLISLFSGIFSAVLLFFLAKPIALNIFNNQELILFLKIFSFLIPVYLFSNIFLSVLQGFEKIKSYSFLINVLQNLVKVTALYLLVLIGVGSNAVIFSYFLGYLILLFFSYFICKLNVGRLFDLNGIKKNKETFSSFFSYSWPLLFIFVFSEIFFWTDTFFIGIFKGATSVGYYNAIVPIALLLAVIPEIFLKLFFPLITREYSSHNLPLVKILAKQVGKWIFILALPLFLILFLFPGLIINFLFGEEYLIGVASLKILAIGAFFSTISWVNQSLLSMLGKSKLILISFMASSVVNIVLNIILIPSYGLYGAAIATTISKLVLGMVYFIEVKHYLRFISLKREIIKVFFISLVPAIVVYWLRGIIQKSILNLALVGVLFFLIYFFLIFITKSFDKNDLMIIKTIKNKILKTKNQFSLTKSAGVDKI